MARYSTRETYESCEPRSVKALDSIHVAKARREQEAVGKNEKPIKAVDSIAVTKARREDKVRREEIEKEVTAFSTRSNDMYHQKKEQRQKANRALNKLREEWLNKARRLDIKPENLRAMMQEHLEAEDKLMRSFLRMWTTADFSPIAVLGKGSFGTVHLVRCTSNERVYALKCISKSYYTRKNNLPINERDALLGDGLLDKTDHWCARLFCSFQDASNLFLVMEFLQGGSLSTHISRRGRLSLEETAFYMAELIEAVDAIHMCFGTIHRDLKPDNMMLTQKGHLKLLDFGLSAGPADKKNDRPEIVGTPAYMAPESFEGYSQVKSDIWAIGIITYECLTGLLPYDEDASYQNFEQRLEHLEEQANQIEAVLPPKLDLAHDLQSVLGATAAKFNKARRFIEGVLRSKEEERFSLRRCQKEAFFEELDFGRLHRMKPPIKIQVSSETDLEYFDVLPPIDLPEPHQITACDPSLEWVGFAVDAQFHKSTAGY